MIVFMKKYSVDLLVGVRQRIHTLILAMIILFSFCYPALSSALKPDMLCKWLADGNALFLSKSSRSEIFTITLKDNRVVTLKFKPQRDGWRSAIVGLTTSGGDDDLQFRLLPPCTIMEGRQLLKQGNRVMAIKIMGPSLEEKSREPQNPPFILNDQIFIPSEPPLLALADTGVNYLLPAFQDSIAVGIDGHLMGYDFWDDDFLPFDKDPRSNPFFPLHHGSTVFSVLDAEGDGVTAALYRFPALEMCRFEELIYHADVLGVRVMNISMGSKDSDDWKCFYRAAQDHSEILFVVSAGNNGINIDYELIYPASFDLANMIVVTSSDIFGRLAPESNYGFENVDLIVPAEQVEVTDHRGILTTTGGSSYAAPRVAALAARFIRHNPDTSIETVINFLKSRAISSSGAFSKYGWIPDPTDDYGF